MPHSPLIAAPESFPISVAHFRRNRRMPKLVAVIDIGPTVIVKVSPRAFHAIVKSATLYLVEFSWERIPLPRRRPRLLVLRRRG
jgi:hypothetical protein